MRNILSYIQSESEKSDSDEEEELLDSLCSRLSASLLNAVFFLLGFVLLLEMKGSDVKSSLFITSSLQHTLEDFLENPSLYFRKYLFLASAASSDSCLIVRTFSQLFLFEATSTLCRLFNIVYPNPKMYENQ